MVAKRRDVGSLGDIRIAQGEDLAVGHRRDSPASVNTPLTLSLGGWRADCGGGGWKLYAGLRGYGERPRLVLVFPGRRTTLGRHSGKLASS